jgi:hypothetical protein
MVEEKPAFDVRMGHKLTVKGNSTGRRQKIAGLQLARQPANPLGARRPFALRFFILVNAGQFGF